MKIFKCQKNTVDRFLKLEIIFFTSVHRYAFKFPTYNAERLNVYFDCFSNIFSCLVTCYRLYVYFEAIILTITRVRTTQMLLVVIVDFENMLKVLVERVKCFVSL